MAISCDTMVNTRYVLSRNRCNVPSHSETCGAISLHWLKAQFKIIASINLKSVISLEREDTIVSLEL